METPPLDDETREMLKAGIRSGIFSAGLAAVRALLVSNEDFRTTLKVWIAGLIAGTIAGTICSFMDASRLSTIVTIIIVAPFISSIWPVLEKWAKNITKRKTEGLSDGDV